jgi:hypothetical protein
MLVAMNGGGGIVERNCTAKLSSLRRPQPDLNGAHPPPFELPSSSSTSSDAPKLRRTAEHLRRRASGHDVRSVREGGIGETSRHRPFRTRDGSKLFC